MRLTQQVHAVGELLGHKGPVYNAGDSPTLGLLVLAESLGMDGVHEQEDVIGPQDDTAPMRQDEGRGEELAVHVRQRAIEGDHLHFPGLMMLEDAVRI